MNHYDESDQRKRPMRLVVIESPYAGDVDTHVRYARAAMADCLRRGESPLASHIVYTQPGILDDSKPEERSLGIRAGFEWAERAHARVVYTDCGISRGMQEGIAHAVQIGQPIEYRSLEGWRR